MSLARRAQFGMAFTETNDPGIEMNPDGSLEVIATDGSRSSLPGGGASFPDEWVVDNDTGASEIHGADVSNGSNIFVVGGNLDAQLFAVYKTGLSGTGVINLTNVEGRVRFWKDFDADADPRLEISSSGKVFLNSLPTADPVNTNQVWNDGGTLKISAG